MGTCALYVFLQVVKHFEILKVLCKFPIIIIIKVLLVVYQAIYLQVSFITV